MAKKKQEEAPKGSPAWMATFSDLMNLLLCFFVLLFSMSTVDAEKFEMIISSFQSSFSILPAGGSSIGEGELISSGISALEMFDVYFNASSAYQDASQNTGDYDESNPNEPTEEITEEQAEEAMTQAGLKESEQMAQQIGEMLDSMGVTDQIEVNFTENYVMINLNGAMLFDAGEVSVREEAIPLLKKICVVINNYTGNLIEVEGHSDNVPPSSGELYATNDEFSMYRALNVANYIRENSDIGADHVKSSGRGEYAPIADNSTSEGRAKNRRVEIKIYNSLNSN
ncbi:MAG: flagellar motor protein MotB [Lachnospiraceae bacterium]|nr:flagellar motor protein MotB [Lachnospiraceae bacterium]